MSHPTGSFFRHFCSLGLAVALIGNAQAGNLLTPRAASIWSLVSVGPRFPTSLEDRAVKTVVDANGDVYVTGVSGNGFASVSTLGTGTLSGVGSASTGGSIFPTTVPSVVNANTGYLVKVVSGTVTSTLTGAVIISGAGSIVLQTITNLVFTGVGSITPLSLVSVSIGEFNMNYFGGSEDYYTAKYSGVDGSLIWSKRFDGGGADRVADMALDPDGNIIVTGSASGNFCTFKYSGLDGTVLWKQQEVAPAVPVGSVYPATAIPVAVAVDPTGNVAVTGYVIGQSFDYFTVKYAKADGSKLWQQQHDGPLHLIDVPSAVAMDAAGNVVVTGYSQGVNLGTTAIAGGVGTIDTIKYATDTGAVLWENIHTEPSTNVSQAKAVTLDSQGNAIITGTVSNGTSFDIYTAKYAAADGSQIWEHRYDGPAALDDIGNAVAVDATDNVIITGYSNNGKDSDIYTAKYAATDGTLIWEQRFDGGHGNDSAQALKVDASGNVTITGSTQNAAGNSDYYTASYAAADGTLRWSQIYDGPAHGNDQAASVSVDASGNAIVTGFSNNGTNDDFYTAKYAVLDGSLLWEQRYNGAALGNQQALAITHDVLGNAIVTGSSRNAAGNLDIYTAKYAAGTGALIWGQTYDGPAHGDDEGRAVAVDASGNVAITGYSYNSSGNKDVYTAKYAAADGTLLWQQIYNGSANTDDFGNAVTVDSAGNVIVVGGSGETANTQPFYYDSTGILTINGAISGTLAANTIDLTGASISAAAGTLTLQSGVTFGGLGVTANDGLYFGSITSASVYNISLTKYGSGSLILTDGNFYTGGLNVTTGILSLGFITPRYVALVSLTTGTGVYANNFTPTPAASLTAVYVVKYAGATGAPLWENKSNSSTADSAAAVTTDAANSIYITGTKNSGYYTAKYAADGLPVWEKSYVGLDGLALSQGRSLAVDSQGNVVVTGTSVGAYPATARYPLQGGLGLYNLDYYTAKYAAKDGSLIWEHRYDGPGGSSVDEAYAVAVDPQGNAVVTGYSDNGAGSCFYTAKYASADGSTIWENRYNDPTGGRDYAKALAMDSAGDVVVTGYSYDTSNLYASTVAYGADGTQLWAYGQPGVNGDATLGSAVTIDSQGSVLVAGSALQDQVGSYLVLRLPSSAQLLVLQPVTTPLPANASVNFGTDNGASLPTKTFTIANTGGINLNLGDITKDGPDSSAYLFTAPASAVLLPGASTSFTVTFASTANGSRQATLHIPSDDPTAPMFNIMLSGIGSSAATTTASQVSAGWATLNGNGNANGASTYAYFQYGATTSYGATTGNLSLGSGATTAPLKFNIAGLARGTTYHYRLVTVSGGVTTYGADQTFVTSPTISPPAWHSAQVTSLTNASLNNMADGARTGAAHTSSELYFYKGTDSNMWCVYLNGSTWTQAQLTTNTNVSDWLAFEPNYGALCYQSNDGNLWCAYHNSTTAKWTTAQLGTLPQGVTVAGDIVVDSSGGWNNVYYRGSDSHLYAAYLKGNIWTHVALGGTATVKGNLAVEGNNHLIYYQGTDNNLWCFYYTGKVWEQVQLSTTANVGGSVAVDSAGLLVYYKSLTDTSAWCTYAAGGTTWTPVQLDATANMSASATSFSNIAPYNAAHDNTEYLDGNGQCDALYYNGSKWGHSLLGDGGFNLTGGLSLQPVYHWLFARRSDGNVVIFYNQ